MRDLVQKTLHSRFAFLGGGSLLITLVGLASFSPALRSRPFDTDNLLALAIGREGRVWHLFTSSFVASLPAYRPVPFLTLIAEYRLSHAPWHFFAVNLAIAILMGIATFGLVWRITGSRLAGVVCGIVMLTDPRVNAALFWIGERQSTMAVILLATAMAFAWGGIGSRSSATLGVLVGLMLLAAALSKEYALAGAPAVAVMALLGERARRSPLLVASAGSLIAYGILRFVVAGGAGGSYCESQGIWTNERLICLSGPPQPGYSLVHGWDKLGQEAWNVCASLVGSAFYFIFSSDGQFAHSTPARAIEGGAHGKVWLAIDVVFFVSVLLLALFAWVTVPRQSLPFLALFLGNAFLSFLVFRTRDQLVGVLGLYAAAAIGFVSLARRLRRSRSPALVQRASLVAVLFIAVWVGWQVDQHRLAQNAQLGDTMKDEAPALCTRVGHIAAGRYIPPPLIRELREYYKMPNPTCDGKAK